MLKIERNVKEQVKNNTAHQGQVKKQERKTGPNWPKREATKEKVIENVMK